MAPDYIVAIAYPHGVQVQNVALLTRANMITATGLNIPTITLEEYGEGSFQPGLRSAESPELWPDTDFEWSLELDPDGGASLIISGEIIQEFRHDEALVAPGGSLLVDDNWNSAGAAAADYTVTAYVAYNGMTAGPVSVKVSSLRRIYLPLVLR